MPIPGFFPLSAKNPEGPGFLELQLPKNLVRHFQERGPAHRFFDSLIIGDVLANPLHIFKGLEREDQGSGYCYAGIPPHRYQNADVTVPPRPGRIFAVYANSDLKIFEWRWEEMDPDFIEERLPKGARVRFGQEIWSASKMQ